jgi:hypothetical protein
MENRKKKEKAVKGKQRRKAEKCQGSKKLRV